ncbi:MAG: hypothetical protein RIS44_360 [Pseudomonadota bacterium]|jgi:hypothetical protein
MIVRSHMPWPLRWVILALMLGFSAALALWAFEFGKEIAGLDRNAKAELLELRSQAEKLKAERDAAVSSANTAESKWKTDQASYDSLVQQLKASQTETMALKADLGFFERLLPANSSGSDNQGISVRGLQLEPQAPGQLRFQLLLMQLGKTLPEFQGRYELTLAGQLDGKPWTWVPPLTKTNVVLKQYLRLEGMIEFPVAAVVKSVTVKVLDTQGAVKASQTTKL